MKYHNGPFCLLRKKLTPTFHKRMKTYYFIFVLLLNSFHGFAQETCKVLLSNIATKYEGACKKGKADGSGKAEGIDYYAGEFKDGLPHGRGIYRWKSGDIYDGDWVKGKMEGQGSKTFKIANKPDSIVKGYWLRDKYQGRFEKPYIIHSQTNQISRIEVRKLSDKPANKIVIELSNTSGGIPSLGVSAAGVKATLTDVVIQSGSYLRIVRLPDGPKGTSQVLMDVEFPFRGRFRIGTQEMSIEILEPGDWMIGAFLNN